MDGVSRMDARIALFVDGVVPNVQPEPPEAVGKNIAALKKLNASLQKSLQELDTQTTHMDLSAREFLSGIEAEAPAADFLVRPPSRRNSKELEGTRRNSKELEGTRRNSKELEGTRRNFEGARRNSTKPARSQMSTVRRMFSSGINLSQWTRI
jgi:hypothetical protein